MGGMLSQGKIWAFAFHEAMPREMEKSRLYRAMVFLKCDNLKPLNICFIQLKHRSCADVGTFVDIAAMIVRSCQAAQFGSQPSPRGLGLRRSAVQNK